MKIQNILCLAILAVPCIAAASDNLLTNGSFENINARGLPSGWNLPEDSRIAQDAADGKAAAEVKGSLSQGGLNLPAGKYILRFQYKKDNPNWLGVLLLCRDKNNKIINRKQLTRYFGRNKSVPEWQAAEYSVDIPEHKGVCRLIFNTHGGLMLIDDVSIRKAEKLVEGEGKLVFEDKFDRAELGPDWIVESGAWQIRNGHLEAKTGGGTEECRIKFARSVGKNFRLEYTCASNSPQDLSAMICSDPAKKGLSGYIFGFASGYNSYNYIGRTGPFKILVRTIQEGFASGANPGQKHRIAVENRDGKLRMFRDGKLELAAEDMFSNELTGKSFGFFTYFQGEFEDVKVYQLPERAGGTVQKAEYPVEKVILHDFSKAEDAAGGNSQIVKFPTWDYAGTKNREQITVDDPCLKSSDARFALPDTDSGIVEFDWFSPENGQSLSAELTDAAGNCSAAFLIDRDGFFHADGADGKAALLNKIEYRRRLMYDDFRIERGKWYTFRLKYDWSNKRIDNIAMLNLYTENQRGYSTQVPVKQGDYISLGGRIPLKASAGKPVSIRFRSDKNPFLLDNVLKFGPVGYKTVNGKSILLDGRTLLKLDFRQRRDPIHLKSQSLRNFTKKYYRHFYMTPSIADSRNGLGKASFQKWTRRYNEAMMLAAFQNERIELLERSAFYRNTAASDFRRKFVKLEQKQEQALLAFADAYLHGADEHRLQTGAESALADFERTLAGLRKELDAADHADKRIPSEPIYHKWALQYDPARRCWTRNGKPEIFISSVSQLHNEPKADFEQKEFILDKVRALGIQPSAVTVGGARSGAPKNGEYFSVNGFTRDVKNSDTLVRQHHLPPYGLAFMSHGTGYIQMPVPLWWLEQNRKDKDIFFSRPDGTPGDKITPVYRGWPKYPFLALNFWNGKVQDYISTRFFLYGKAMSSRPDLFGNVMFYLGGESKIELPAGMAPGYGKSATAAFQAYLKKKYGIIDGLNRKWGTNYASFETIVPPPPAAEPSPLRYEFRTFVHREYFDRFIRLAKENLEKGFGRKLAIGHDFQDTFSDFDMPSFFDNVSIGMFHSYQIWDRKIYPKYLRSLAEASGTPWCSLEWGPTQGNKTMFDMAETKLHALREISHQIMFGSIAPNMFYEDLNQYPNEWQYGFPLTDHRLGYMPFNYFASFWRLAKERAVRFGEKALTAKSVIPDAVVLEVDSARRNALPERCIYTMCKAFSTFMEQQNMLYGFRFEKFVSDGRQKLDGIQVVFVPNGIVMTEELDSKLETYLRNGGTVIAFAPPGVYNEYGKPKTGGLLAKAFPGVKWTHQKYSRWFADGKQALCRQAKLGLGTLYVFDNPNQWDTNLPEFRKLLKRYIQPSLTCSQNDFQFSYLEADGARYLYVLNYNINQTCEGEFSVPGSVKVTDLSLASPQVLSVTKRKGRTVFRTKLAPSALALFKIEAAQK